jgi:hypothetical protein
METTKPTDKRIIRLAEVDPTGKAVNAVIVKNLQMWVRCFWPDLVALKPGPAPKYEPILKDCKISSPYKVYEIGGNIIKEKKRYGEALEVKIQVTDAVDITSSAQLVLDRAKAYHDEHNDWPEDDKF